MTPSRLPDHAAEKVVLESFLARYHADEERGEPRALADYQADHPEHAEAIQREWTRLRTRTRPELPPTGPIEKVGPYRIGRPLGRGGQGIVFTAEDTRLGREVAVKVLAGWSARADAGMAERFHREAEMASRLDHPGICPVWDMDLDHEPPYLVMPLLEGRPLAGHIATSRHEDVEGAVELGNPPSSTTGSRAGLRSVQPPDVDRVLALVESLAHALHAAHEAGVVHRDVKPGNIFVRRDGHPVLLDFGLARTPDELPGHAMTRSGQFPGTLPYMAPEQLNADPETGLDRRVDIHALGAVLYECLTLQRPFDGRTDHALAEQILHARVPDPRRLRPRLDRDIVTVLEMAMAKEPAHRYRTAHEFADDLRRIRESRPILARPTPAWRRVSRWVRRDPWLAGAAGITLLAVLGALLATVQNLRSREAALERVQAAQRETAEEQRLRQVALDELLLGDLERRVEGLWPARPEVVSAVQGMDHWLAEAEALRDRMPGHRRHLAELEARALGSRPADVDPLQERRQRAAAERLEEHRQVLAYRLTKFAEFPERAEEARSTLQPRIDALRHDLDTQPPSFASAADALTYRSLHQLAARGDALDRWITTIEARRERARSITQRTVDAHREDWMAAARRVAAMPEFDGLRLAPHVGLVPLGPDPRTGLEEFAVLETGEIPARDATSSFRIDPETAMVLVLVPGGSTLLGASAEPDEAGPYAVRLDPRAKPVEGPVQHVQLAPFLIAKHPMTQGQWLRITGENPSGNRAGQNIGGHEITLAHPVESMSWTRAREVLARLELDLPTEAQWEHAARAGTDTPWWTGADLESVDGAGNIADAYVESVTSTTNWDCESWMDDGHYVHAPVGLYRANAFGLHDVIGQVYEWCRDSYGNYDLREPRDGDGLLSAIQLELRSARGAGYSSPARSHRMSARARFEPDFEVYFLGVRPARYPVRTAD